MLLLKQRQCLTWHHLFENANLNGWFLLFQELHSTIEDTYVASVDTGRGQRDILRIYDTAGLQGTVQVLQIN